MIVTTYTCDKCGHSQETRKQMWELGITSHCIDGPSRYNTPKEKALWCRKCTQSLGLLPQEKTDPPTPEPVLTLEDIVREIIHEEVEASQA